MNLHHVTRSVKAGGAVRATRERAFIFLQRGAVFALLLLALLRALDRIVGPCGGGAAASGC